MAVNIDVELDLDLREIAEVETKLQSIGDGVDFGEIEIEEIIDGDLDDVLDFDDFEDKIGDLDDLNLSISDSEKESESEINFSRTITAQLGRIHAELQRIHRSIQAGGVSESGTLSTASFRDFQNWVSESDADSDSDAEASSRGFDPLEIDTNTLGSMDLGDDSDRLDFADTLPMQFGADEIPPQHLIDTQKKIDPFAFINRDRSDFGSSSISEFSSNIIDPRDKINRDTAGIDPNTRLNVNLDRDLKNRINIPDRLRRSRDSSVDADTLRLGRDLDLPEGIDRRRIRRLNKSVAAMSTFAEVGSTVGRVLNRVRPRIGQIYNAIAALIPILIGLAGAGAAAAISLSSLLVIGGAIGILGALGGEADTLKGSVKDLQDRIGEFKTELFEALQPVADPFAPLFDRGLGLIVGQVRGLREELLGFRQFGGLFLDGIEGAGTLTENLFAQFNRLAPMIEQMARRVGGFIQSALPGFFAAATKEAFEHQNAIAGVLDVFWSIGRFIYNASVILLEFISAFSFLGGLVSWIAGLLNNRFVRSLIIVLGTLGSLVGLLLTMGYLTAVLNKLLLTQGGILSALASTWVGSMVKTAIGGLSTLIGWVTALNGKLAIAAGLMSAVTLGAAAVIGVAGISAAMGAITSNSPSNMPGGAPSTSSSFGRGSGGVTNVNNNVEMNIRGDVNERDRQFFKDAANEMASTRSNRNGSSEMIQ